VVFLCAGDGDTSHLDEAVPMPGSFELVPVSSGTLLCGTLRNFEFRNSFYLTHHVWSWGFILWYQEEMLSDQSKCWQSFV
jgi:hypothetical protein